MIGARTLWRAPVWIGFLQQGHYTVGALNMDAQHGALLDPEQGVAAIRVRAMQIAAALPACRPNPQVAADYLAPDAMRAENLSPAEAGCGRRRGGAPAGRRAQCLLKRAP